MRDLVPGTTAWAGMLANASIDIKIYAFVEVDERRSEMKLSMPEEGLTKAIALTVQLVDNMAKIASIAPFYHRSDVLGPLLKRTWHIVVLGLRSSLGSVRARLASLDICGPLLLAIRVLRMTTPLM
jgi:hypothetical protein